MSEPVAAYAAAEIDPILDELSEKLASALGIGQATAEALDLARAEIATLKESQSKVTLEKVASTAPAALPGAEDVAALVTSLVDNHIIKAASSADFTKRLLESPGNLVKLASRLITLSHPAPSGGQGVEKSASQVGNAVSDLDEDGWGLCVTKGA